MSMPHVRRQLRDGVAARLADVDEVRLIEAHMSARPNDSDLPAIDVQTVREAVERSDFDGFQMRTQTLRLVLYVNEVAASETVADRADRLAASVEELLAGQTFGVLFEPPQLTLSEFGFVEDGAEKLTFLTLEYSCPIHSPIGQSAVAQAPLGAVETALGQTITF